MRKGHASLGQLIIHKNGEYKNVKLFDRESWLDTLLNLSTHPSRVKLTDHHAHTLHFRFIPIPKFMYISNGPGGVNYERNDQNLEFISVP